MGPVTAPAAVVLPCVPQILDKIAMMGLQVICVFILHLTHTRMP
jgi:hypothetical protein